MKFNKKFLITVENLKAEELGVKAYRYKTCSVIDSREEYKGSMMHIVSLRTKDCRSNLSKEELYGILDAAPYGFASYDPDDMNLRYAATLQDGTDVELLLRYEDNYLTEILIQSIRREK